jgi:hypothetical protein
VDCTSFYDFLEEKRSGVTAALKQGLSERGPKLVSAVDDFVEAVTPGNNPAAHSMSGILLCGFRKGGSKAIIGDARGLVMNAVHRSRDLAALIKEVRREGVFNRTVAASSKRINEMKGFMDFCPKYRAGQAAMGTTAGTVHCVFRSVCK